MLHKEKPILGHILILANMRLERYPFRLWGKVINTIYISVPRSKLEKLNVCYPTLAIYNQRAFGVRR